MSYSPVVGRFMQRDPLGYVDGANRYQYERGNSVLLTDATGLAVAMSPATAVGIVAGPVGSTVQGVAVQIGTKIPGVGGVLARVAGAIASGIDAGSAAAWYSYYSGVAAQPIPGMDGWHPQAAWIPAQVEQEFQTWSQLLTGPNGCPPDPCDVWDEVVSLFQNLLGDAIDRRSDLLQEVSNHPGNSLLQQAYEQANAEVNYYMDCLHEAESKEAQDGCVG